MVDRVSPKLSTTGQTEPLFRIVEQLLSPTLIFAVRKSLRLQELLHIIKVALINVAVNELEENGDTVSASKIALMTGVHRKDIALLLQDKISRSPGLGVTAKIIGQWKNDRRFTTKSGRPRPLSYIGKNSEFSRLVRATHKELNSYSVLFELERIKAVKSEKGLLHLVKSEYVPFGRSEDQFRLLAQDIYDLIKAGEENIFELQDPPNLHLSTTYDNIIEESLPQIRKWFMDEGAALHDRARKYLSKFDKDLNTKLSSKQGGARVVIGTFGLTEITKNR